MNTAFTVLLLSLSFFLWLKLIEVFLHMLRYYPSRDVTGGIDSCAIRREWPISSVIDRATIRLPRIIRRVVFRFKVLTVLLILVIALHPQGQASVVAGVTLYIAMWIQLARILVDQAKYGSASYLRGLALPNPLLDSKFGGPNPKHRLRAFLSLFLGLCSIIVLGYAALYCLSHTHSGGTAFKGVPNDRFGFIHFCYFSIVTLATVGYGDISPSEQLLPRILVGSQIVAGFMVLVTLVTSVSLTFQNEQ